MIYINIYLTLNSFNILKKMKYCFQTASSRLKVIFVLIQKYLCIRLLNRKLPPAVNFIGRFYTVRGFGKIAIAASQSDQTSSFRRRPESMSRT